MKKGLRFIKKNLVFIVFIGLTCLTVVALARAGGGGGHGGGGGGSHGSSLGRRNGSGEINPIYIFIACAWGAYTVALTLMLFLRTQSGENLVRRISKKDPFWELNFLIENARRSFFEIQKAWEQKNMNLVKKTVTADLYHNYTALFNDMRTRGEKNIIRDIDISAIRIICCQDYNDNSKDKYIAHIKGELLDYTIDERTKHAIKNEDKEREEFTDAFYFVRVANKWMLDDIVNDPGFWHLSDAKSHSEQTVH